MERKLIKVSGHDNLARDPITGAILTINDDGRMAYKAKRKKQEETMNRIASLESDVKDMKSSLNKIEMMLAKLMEKDVDE